LYVHFRQTAKRSAYLAALICFFLAMLSKENAFVFPLILLAAEYLVMPHRRIKPVAGVFLLAAGLFLYRFFALGGIGGYSNLAGERTVLHGGVFKVLQGLFIRDPALILLGFNWAQPGLATTIVMTSLASGVLLILALFSKPAPAMWKRFAFCLTWIVLPLIPVHFFLLINPDLTNSRILYLSSAGMAILVAHVLVGLHPMHLRWLSAALFVCVCSAGVLHNIGAWRWATEREQRVLSELKQIDPAPAPKAQYVFHDLPKSLRGVYFLDGGLQDAVRITLRRNDITARRESSPFRPGDTGIHIQWTGKGGTLIMPNRRTDADP
jgi:hypothetical protein